MLSWRDHSIDDVSDNICRCFEYIEVSMFRIHEGFILQMRFARYFHVWKWESQIEWFFFVLYFPFHQSFFIALRSSCSGIFWNSAVESVFINVSCLSSYMDIFLGFFWNSQNIFSLEQLWMTASKLFGTFSWKFPVIDLFCLKPFHLSFDK